MGFTNNIRVIARPTDWQFSLFQLEFSCSCLKRSIAEFADYRKAACVRLVGNTTVSETFLENTIP